MPLLPLSSETEAWSRAAPTVAALPRRPRGRPVGTQSAEAERWRRNAPTEAEPSAMLERPPPETLPRRPPRT